MFKNNHFKDDEQYLSRPKPSKKNREDTQLDLYADFDRLDSEAKAKEKEEEAKKLAGVGVYPSPEKLQEMLAEGERRLEEARAKEASWRSRREGEKWKKLRGKSFADIIHDAQIEREQKKAEKERIKKEEEAAMQKIRDYIKGVEPEKDPNDDIDEDGFIKPDSPSEEYYGRFR